MKKNIILISSIVLVLAVLGAALFSYNWLFDWTSSAIGGAGIATLFFVVILFIAAHNEGVENSKNKIASSCLSSLVMGAICFISVGILLVGSRSIMSYFSGSSIGTTDISWPSSSIVLLISIVIFVGILHYDFEEHTKQHLEDHQQLLKQLNNMTILLEDLKKRMHEQENELAKLQNYIRSRIDQFQR